MLIGYWVECFVVFAGRFHNWMYLRQAGWLAKLLARPDCLLNQQLDVIQTGWIHSFFDIRLNCYFYSWLILSLVGFYTDWLTRFMPGQPVGSQPDWLFDWKDVWLAGRLTALMLDWLAGWLVCFLDLCFAEQLTDLLYGRLACWLVVF